ncbi:actin-domain-containing protein [Basidiobolus meristosporus CBS 931.73]|uniref:Actin-domain-containing protein n=1 Tax=Basidiobolus meristosporus CBS 931.73 TaxID=1314790 RepID=A0A1Y1YCG2_9FUNG|nr:actin-domain-containing protein [Basidiobolus meristosporus CBS 931.73]|eukprot:ORX95623.1 actin-domain-containing protein [Basidiobolus meristosporus CBS 931.73]
MKEDHFVVINTGSSVVKVVKGVHDTNKTPQLTIPTLVGKEVLEQKDNDNADLEEENQEAIKKGKQYVFGPQLDEPASELSLIRPVERGWIEDWEALEQLWRHILVKELKIKRSKNDSPVLLTIPTFWPKDYRERITQFFFETMNVPGLYLAEEPLMALYGCGIVSGTVIDIGHTYTEITPIIDNTVQYHAAQVLPLGGRDIDQYLVELLKQDSELCLAYGEEIPVEFARFVKESEICAMNVEPTDEVKDRAEIEYKSKKFMIGDARFRCAEPLFDPSLVGVQCLSLPEAIHLAIFSCEPEKRATLWENVILTGGVSKLKGLKDSLQSSLSPFLANSENLGDNQNREVKFGKIPDYFTQLKERTEFASFLGASIVAKLVFPDPKSHITKVDYNESGPSIIHTKG